MVTRIAPQHLLSLAYVCKIAACGTLFATTGIPQLYLAQALLGLTEGIQNPAYRALVATSLDKNHETAESADWEIILAVTGIIGTALGGYIASHYGFHALFIAIGSISGISLLLSRFIQK